MSRVLRRLAIAAALILFRIATSVFIDGSREKRIAFEAGYRPLYRRCVCPQHPNRLHAVDIRAVRQLLRAVLARTFACSSAASWDTRGPYCSKLIEAPLYPPSAEPPPLTARSQTPRFPKRSAATVTRAMVAPSVRYLDQHVHRDDPQVVELQLVLCF